jgi:hypothetical protein
MLLKFENNCAGVLPAVVERNRGGTPREGWTRYMNLGGWEGEFARRCGVQLKQSERWLRE